MLHIMHQHLFASICVASFQVLETDAPCLPQPDNAPPHEMLVLYTRFLNMTFIDAYEYSTLALAQEVLIS